MPTGAAGSSITLDANFVDGTGSAVTPVSPLVDIIDPALNEVVSNAVPTQVGPVGHYEYVYAIPSGGPLGAWTAHWTGTINSVPQAADEVFQVVAAGSISFPGGSASAEICSAWADAADACAPCDDYEFDPALLEDGIQMASSVLWNLTGRRWTGLCTELIRPPSACGCGAYTGSWFAGSGCGCGCGGVSEYILPGYPAVTVDEVTIDGQIIDPARYRVDDRQRLVFQPDLDDTTDRHAWPCCQRISRPLGEEGTWSVLYTHGQEPPLGGVKAAASLGCQLALACLPADSPGGKACRLPKRVTSITRQGVTLAIIDPLSLFKDGLTGLPEVDLWVQSILIGDQRRRGHVFVPGRKRGRRTN